LLGNFFEPDLTAQKYIAILKGGLFTRAEQHFGETEWILQQDGDPAHAAEATEEFLSNAEINHNFSRIEWPPSSPDLNPIENVWAEIQNRISREPICSSKEELKAKVVAIIKQLNSAKNRFFFENLYNSMPRRVKAVLKARGHATKY
jgi:hypothetical protein